jgi:hypothetical protein
MKCYRDPLDIWLRRNLMKSDMIIMSICAAISGAALALIYLAGTGSI